MTKAAVDLTGDMLRNHWADKVRSRRTELRMTQRDLAAAVGVHQNAIHQIEAAVTFPTDPHKLRIAQALRIHPSDLFTWPVSR